MHDPILAHGRPAAESGARSSGEFSKVFSGKSHRRVYRESDSDFLPWGIFGSLKGAKSEQSSWKEELFSRFLFPNWECEFGIFQFAFRRLKQRALARGTIDRRFSQQKD